MNVMPQNKLDELRRDYECPDEEIADIEEFTEKAGKAEKYTADFDFHLLLAQKSAMIALRDVMGMRLIREYFKMNKRPVGFRKPCKRMTAMVRNAQRGFKGCDMSDPTDELYENGDSKPSAPSQQPTPTRDAQSASESQTQNPPQEDKPVTAEEMPSAAKKPHPPRHRGRFRKRWDANGNKIDRNESQHQQRREVW